MALFSFPSSTFQWSRGCFITHTKPQLCPLFCRKSNLSGQSSYMVVVKAKWSNGVTLRNQSHWLAGSFMTCCKTNCDGRSITFAENIFHCNSGGSSKKCPCDLQSHCWELHLHKGTALSFSFQVRCFCCCSVKVWGTHSVAVWMCMVLPGCITQYRACMQALTGENWSFTCKL